MLVPCASAYKIGFFIFNKEYMGKDPAFLFYPGDYLKDTQNLNEVQQVAYDRIMCEHIRNICITQAQLNFFTKRLSEQEKVELLLFLKQIDNNYQIEWVAESIEKRRAYSQSRKENREKYKKKICKRYDKHMEIENENENGNINGNINENGNENGNENKNENEKKVKSEFEKTLDEFYKMRKSIKKPMTDRAKNMLLSELEKLAANDEQLKIKILEQSIFHSWQGVFPLKNDNIQVNKKSSIYDWSEAG